MKKMLSIILAVMMLLVPCTLVVNADEKQEVITIDEYITRGGAIEEVPENMIVVSELLRDGSKPTSTTAWDSNNKIIYDGSADIGYKVFSKGFFTGAKEVKFSFTNTRSAGSITIQIWEETAVMISTASKKIDAGDTLTFTLSNLDSSKKYYVASSGPTKFTGYAIKIK